MNIQIARPDVQARLERIVRESGLPSNAVVEDALIGYSDEVPRAVTIWIAAGLGPTVHLGSPQQ